MIIKEIGGEFGLIRRIAELLPADRAEVVKGIGDDAAVLRIAPEPSPYLLVTTDLLVENRHFRRTWSTPEQIGMKAAECNMSDIAAMGGSPQWMFVSIVLPADTEVEWVESLYRGMGRSCQQHGVVLLGGDTTQGDVITINITLLGSVDPDHLCLRRHGRPGDLLMVTGTLGASAAAYALLSNGYRPSKYLLHKHLTPASRLDVSSRIAPFANAMIDISDGLAAEVRHICAQSAAGARINSQNIPIHDDVKAAGRTLGIDPVTWALSGGEDFELLFSVSPERLAQLKAQGCVLHEVGRITDAEDGILLMTSSGEAIPLPGGFDHFE
ncbi:MAG: thiamine-phosphate kinase [Desulfobacteraceae bacterium]|nr:MAG: thiamine-phosphate kinase [Desulfobacteraceae bacterium]